MSVLCNLFGHARPRQGWWGDGLYGKVWGGYVDGIGRSHFQVWLDCPRCGEDYIAARFHGAQADALLAERENGQVGRMGRD
jgi:hypothetical protein